MIASLRSACLQALEAQPVQIECDAGPGLPGFSIVGLADGAVRESRDRVLSALRNAGWSIPPRRITVNLAPSDLRKEGSALDLAVALAVLVAIGETVPAPAHLDRVLLGELGLDGRLRPVRGLFALAAGLAEAGCPRVLVPGVDAPLAALVPGLDVVACDDLAEAAALLEGRREPRRPPAPPVNPPAPEEPGLEEVRGQEPAKRALLLAAAGGHNLLFSGPPGSGKTLLARSLPGLLPDLLEDDAREVTRIHSAAGLWESSCGLLRRPPLRAPHHSASLPALVGGGPVPRPGEVSLAHRGVLFLDEMAEFDRRTLDALRQPLEDGRVSVARVQGVATFPSRVQLVGAMNPCPCGHLGDRRRPCTCSPQAVARYRGRLSGPILDRIDLHIDVPALPPGEWLARPTGETSASMRGRVLRARALQWARSRRLNTEVGGEDLRRACALDASALRVVERLAEGFALSARAMERVLRVARTAADLEGEERVREPHLAEAAAYRAVEGRGG